MVAGRRASQRQGKLALLIGAVHCNTAVYLEAQVLASSDGIQQLETIFFSILY